MTDSSLEHRRVKGRNLTGIMSFLYKGHVAMTTTLTGEKEASRSLRLTTEDGMTELESGQTRTPKGLRDGGHGGP